jgi:hypothetical protein
MVHFREDCTLARERTVKLIGILTVFAGMFVLALEIFDAATPPPWAIWAPIGAGVLLMLVDRNN